VPAADTQSAATDPADALPKEGVVMAVQHRTLPIMAVQFHPESILSLQARAGHQLVHNVVQYALAVYKPASHQSESRSEPLFN
jgi:anthranilate/para-aminobenzoate synthase component II